MVAPFASFTPPVQIVPQPIPSSDQRLEAGLGELGLDSVQSYLSPSTRFEDAILPGARLARLPPMCLAQRHTGWRNVDKSRFPSLDRSMLAGFATGDGGSQTASLSRADGEPRHFH